MDVIGPLLPRNRRRKQTDKNVTSSPSSRDYGVLRPVTTPLSLPVTLLLESSKLDLILPLPVFNLEFPKDLFDNLTPIIFDRATPTISERSIMDEFPSPPTQHVLFDDERLRAERKRQKKQAKLLQKSSKPERYHHTPTFAAQSFTLTATPEIYKTDQTHKLSRPVLDQAKTRRSRTPKVVQPFDDRSSGEYDRISLVTPTVENGRSTPAWGTRDQKRPKSPPSRFMTTSPHYELFSSAILNQNTPGTTGRGVFTPDSFTRGRPDWSEMDERVSDKGLRRSVSVYSTKSSKSSKSQRPKSQMTEFATVLKGNAVLRVPRAGDAESIYQGRGCVPWRIRAM